MAVVQANSGNILVQNYGSNPAVNFNFMLRVEGVFDLPCRSVHVFQKENEYELIQEGGLNDYVHMRRKPISRPFTFQVERYVGTDILDPLANGTDLALPVILMVNRYRIYGDFLPVRMYVFTGCTVMSKEYGELHAEKAGLLVETTTIAYREMVCIDDVAGSFLMEEPWQFNGTSKEGRGSRSARRPREEKSAQELEQRAKKWMVAGGNSARESEGSSGQNAQPDFRGINGSTTDNAYARAEIRKDAMEENAHRWTFHAEDSGVPEEGAEAMPAFLGANGSTTGSTYVQNEIRKQAMEEKAVKWSFGGGTGEGEDGAQADFLGSNGSTTGSTYAQSETRKSAMEERAQRWPPTRSAMDTAKFLAGTHKNEKV